MISARRGTVLSEYGIILGFFATMFISVTAPLISSVDDIFTAAQSRMDIQPAQVGLVQDDGEIHDEDMEETPLSIKTYQEPIVVAAEQGIIVRLPVIGTGSDSIFLAGAPEVFEGTALELRADNSDIVIACSNTAKCPGSYGINAEVGSHSATGRTLLSLELIVTKPSFGYDTPAGDLQIVGSGRGTVARIEVAGTDEFKFHPKPDGLRGTGYKLEKGPDRTIDLVCQNPKKCTGTTFFTAEITSRKTGEKVRRSFAISL